MQLVYICRPAIKLDSRTIANDEAERNLIQARKNWVHKIHILVKTEKISPSAGASNIEPQESQPVSTALSSSSSCRHRSRSGVIALVKLDVPRNRRWRVAFRLGSDRVEFLRTLDESRGPEEAVDRHGEPERERVEQVKVSLVRREVSVVPLRVLGETESGSDLFSRTTRNGSGGA